MRIKRENIVKRSVRRIENSLPRWGERKVRNVRVPRREELVIFIGGDTEFVLRKELGGLRTEDGENAVP